MISHNNDRKECMELMKKIEVAIYSAHNTICNCDMSLIESDFNKLLKDKQKCVPCRIMLYEYFQQKMLYLVKKYQRRIYSNICQMTYIKSRKTQVVFQIG